MPKEEPDQERFERKSGARLAEVEAKELTSIRNDIVSLLVTGSENALLRHHKTSSTTGGDPKAAAPGLRARGRAFDRGSL